MPWNTEWSVFFFKVVCYYRERNYSFYFVLIWWRNGIVLDYMKTIFNHILKIYGFFVKCIATRFDHIVVRKNSTKIPIRQGRYCLLFDEPINPTKNLKNLSIKCKIVQKCFFFFFNFYFIIETRILLKYVHGISIHKRQHNGNILEFS